MTPAEICCGECRSIHQCRRRCGLEPAAGIAPAPPASPPRSPARDGGIYAAIGLWVGLTAALLKLAGAI